MAVAQTPPSYFGDSVFSHQQLATPFPSLSTTSLALNDTCPFGLGPGAEVSSSLAMAAHQSHYFNSSSEDNAAFWNFAPFVSDYYTLGTNLQTVVESMYPPVDDTLSLGIDMDFLSHGPVSVTWSSGCTTPVMHPNLVSTLKSMVAHSDVGSSSGFGGPFHLFDQQPDPKTASMSTHIANSQLFDTYAPPSLNIGDPVNSIMTSGKSCITQQQQHPVKPTIKQEMEKSNSSSDDNIEATVVTVDLIQNRRPFRCGHDGCNKTFKNPQTMKMHHKTHYADGSGASRVGLASSLSLTSSLKAGHNKKIPSRCPKCKKTFVGLYELRRHYGRKHSEGEKGFGCRKCGKKFYIEVDVRDHEKLCGEPIECKCGLKFAFKCNLVAHKKAHPTCQDNNNAATTSSSDSSDQSRENLPTPLVHKPASSSRSAGSQGSSRSQHRQQKQQQEVASGQSFIPSLPDFSEDFKQSADYNLSQGAHFPLSPSPDYLWPPMQYITEFNSAPAATQLHTFSNFDGSSDDPFFSSSVSEISRFSQHQQQHNNMSLRAGLNLLEDLVDSNHGMHVTTSLPTSMGTVSAAAYYNSTSFFNLQAALDNRTQYM